MFDCLDIVRVVIQLLPRNSWRTLLSISLVSKRHNWLIRQRSLWTSLGYHFYWASPNITPAEILAIRKGTQFMSEAGMLIPDLRSQNPTQQLKAARHLRRLVNPPYVRQPQQHIIDNDLIDRLFELSFIRGPVGSIVRRVQKESLWVLTRVARSAVCYTRQDIRLCVPSNTGSVSPIHGLYSRCYPCRTIRKLFWGTGNIHC